MATLLFIDPHFDTRSPSLKSVLREAPESFSDFDRVEVWATATNVPGDGDWYHFDRIWCPFQLWNLLSVWFWLAANLRYWWRYKVRGCPRPTVVQATNYYCYGADLIYLHFSMQAYFGVMREHREHLRLGVVRKASLWVHLWQELALFKWAAPGWWWVVSRRLAEECERKCAGGGQFRVLPNSYDGGRFSAEKRAQYRAEMRQRLGFDPADVVFVFVALGGLERKGFPLAAQAVSRLAAAGRPARLLVVGGPTEEPVDLTPYLQACGVTDDRFITRVGRVPDIERYLAAADALLFPSYCEAFALVEIEAAAMGLRLYLTRHYGSEMIVREPGNGRFLPWDGEGIARVLAEEMDSGAVRASTGEMGEALDSKGFLSATRRLYQEILAGRTGEAS